MKRIRKRKKEFVVIVIVVGVISILPVFFSGFGLDFLIMTAIWIILATSLRLIMSLGLVSFAHVSFMAIGAYASTLLTMNIGTSFWAALPLSGLVSAFLGLIVGYPLLRTKGGYFFLATFTLGMAILLVFYTQFRDTLGGSLGISNIPPPGSAFTSLKTYYYMVWVLVGIVVAIIYRLDRSRIGLEMHAVRSDDALSASIGIDIIKLKLSIFTLACFFAGIAGSLYAHYVRFISPEAFEISSMLTCLTYVVVGGMYGTWGPTIGVFMLRMITLGVGGLREWEMMIYSATLILFIFLLPEGLISLGERMQEFTGKVLKEKAKKDSRALESPLAKPVDRDIQE